MVVDRLENIEKYASLNPLFAQAIEFLKSHDLNALEVGKTELKGKDLLVNVAQTKPKAKEDASIRNRINGVYRCQRLRSGRCSLQRGKGYYFLCRSGGKLYRSKTWYVCHFLPTRRTCSRYHSGRREKSNCES